MEQAYLLRLRAEAAERLGRVESVEAQTLLRDRTCYPDTLCREPDDTPGRDVMTFASLVAVPASRELWVAVGPPHQHAHQRHTFSA